MGTLTKKEREGLEDVFLSIHATTNKYDKLKNFISFTLSKYSEIDFKKLLKVAKYGLKETKLSQNPLNLSKKKKNLSK